MSTKKLTIGIDVVRRVARWAPTLLTPRFAPGCAISVLLHSVGDRKHTACVLSASGAIVAEEAITNTRECLTVFAQRYPRATIITQRGGRREREGRE